ncbi:MAG: LamG-like jellyroll fold domain-containing protein, partial [Saprospiraceae bacterium]
DYSVLTLDSFSTWNWSFPNAQYVSNKNIRNPKVVFGKIGLYDVTLKIQNRLGESTKTINGMIQISANECGIDSFAGKCLDLSNSSDYATLERIPELKNATGFSCMAWVKLNSKQDCFTQILSNWDSNVGFGFGFAFQGYVQTRNLTFFWKGVPYQLTSPFNLDTLTWVHVAMVVYPDSVRLYRDGISWTYKGNFKDFDLSETPWEVGTGVRGQCGNFQGQMDELKIYNRSLTELEIRENIHLIHPEGENGLVAYYQFNESSNPEIYNRVGGYHGANAGGVKIYSTAPVGTGFSDHKILSTGLNNFPLTKTDIQISTIKKPNSTWFNYRLLNQPDSTLVTAEKWNQNYYILRSFENPNSETAINLTFSNTGILLDNYRFAPEFLKLYHRDISNEHLNSWKFVANASSINIVNQSIQFNNIQEINGQFIIEVLPNPTRLHDLGNNSNYGIYIYPNPAIGKIQIHTYDLGQTGILKIQDINGNTIYSKSIPSFVQENVDIHSWPSGVYIVTFNERWVKFVKID